uniref:Virion infectivity factor n=1 Tax=Simian immunodeficiency virus TaxID=11723 RepID=A6XBJ8_SIV|nr:vif protein [Simian immunodeficiency virus]
MENRWQVQIVWMIDRMRLRTWNSLVKHHIYTTKCCKEWKYRHHYETDVPKRAGEIHIPLTEKSKLVVLHYWGLACGERPWHLGHGVGLEWRQGKYCTQVDPETADQLIHTRYFTCFAAGAVRQAILGERILTFCHFQTGHRQVGTLQFLAFKKVVETQYKKPKGPRRPLPSVTKLTEDRWNKHQRTTGHKGNHTMNGC